MRKGLLVCSAGILLAASAQANVLLYDGFDYPLGNDIAGQNGGTGWNSGWSTAGTPGGAITGRTVVAGLSFSDYPTAGNAYYFASNRNQQAGATGLVASRQLGDAGVPATGSSLYISYLARFEMTNSDTISASAALSRISTANDAGGGTNRYQTRLRDFWQGNGPGSSKPGVGYNGDITNSAAGINLQTTYLVVSRFSNINGGSGQHGEMWVIDAAGYDTIKADGLTESELSSVAIAGANEWVGSETLAGTRYFQLYADSNYGNLMKVTYDEVRLSTSIADVAAPVPEPTATLFLGIAAAATLARRRRA